MTILYIHQYFRTPADGGAIRSYHLAKGMIEAGHRVVMLTGHDHDELEVKAVDGIEVHYLPVPYSNALGRESRISAFLKFVRMAVKEAKHIKADIAYITSTPLTVGLIALYLKFFKQLPYIFEVRDLWPEAPIQMGALPNPVMQKAMRGLEKRIYKNAKAVVALSPGMEAGVRQVWPSADIHMIPNFSDCEFFRAEDKKEELLVKYGLTINDFIISYLGTLGPANGLDHLLQLADRCKVELPTVRFLICGDGAERERLMKVVEEKKITNLKFLPASNKEVMRELLNISDATICTFKNVPILQTNSPNKFFDSLAAGRMVIVNTYGWLKELVEANDCGFHTSPDATDDFVETIEPFINDREKTQTYGRNARSLAERQFSKTQMKQRVSQLIKGISS